MDTNAPIVTALLGHGNVGAAVRDRLEAHHPEVDLRYVLVRDKSKHQETIEQSSATFLTDFSTILDDGDVRLVIELMGSPEDSHSHIRDTLNAGKHVVTANKVVMSTSGRDLSAIALNKGCELRFEGSVGGGLPLIRLIRQLRFDYGMDFIAGILNGTSNYILTHLANGEDYPSALKSAQRRGLAEDRPTNDIDGTDSSQKLAILSSLGFGTWVDGTKLQPSGIKGETTDCVLFNQDFWFFWRETRPAYEIKLLSVAYKTSTDELELTTGLSLVPHGNVLSLVSYEANALWASGPGIQQQYFFGPGAGPDPTAIAVLSGISDVVDRISGVPRTSRRRNDFGGRAIPIVNPKDIRVAGFIRSVSADVPGIFGRKLNILQSHGINVQRVVNYQSPIPSLGGAEPDYIQIDATSAGVLESAMAELAALDDVLDEPVFFRIEHRLPRRAPTPIDEDEEEDDDSEDGPAAHSYPHDGASQAAGNGADRKTR